MEMEREKKNGHGKGIAVLVPKVSSGRHPTLQEMQVIWDLDAKIEDLQHEVTRATRDLKRKCSVPPSFGLDHSRGKWGRMGGNGQAELVDFEKEV